MKKILIGFLMSVISISSVGISQVKSTGSRHEVTLNLTKNSPVKIVKSQDSNRTKIAFGGSSAIRLTRNKIVVASGLSNEEIAAQNKAKEEAAKKAAAAKTVAKATTAVASTVCKTYSGSFNTLYQSASSAYGVPWQILAAVHSVETGQSGDTTRANKSGATGPMQFIPSTWRAYGVDGDGDGVARITSVVDAVYGAAHYISANMRVKGSVAGALYQYNHSSAYVNKVLSIARSFGYTG